MKTRILIFILLMLNVGIYVTAQYSAMPSEYEQTYSSRSDDFGAVLDSDCHNGGPGATNCSIDAGISMGASLTTACSVTCGSGFYACCGLRCFCKKITIKQQ